MELKINHEALKDEDISYKPREYMRVIADQQNEFGVVIYAEKVVAYGPLAQVYVFVADQITGGIETADLSAFAEPPPCTYENLVQSGLIY
jgi:hypothetical protein